MRFICAVIILFTICFNSIVFPQGSDTLKKESIKPDTVKLNFDYNKIHKFDVISDLSDTVGYDYFIWNDKRNLQEILNERSGFYAYFFGTGGKSFLNYNGLPSVGVFRNGIDINDQFYGAFDVENISVNEIEKIEEVSAPLSFIYGMNPYGKIINIIGKDRFQPNLFTQFRYSQDRDGATFADAFMNFPVSRKFNFLLGINSHASDGHFQNSDFAFWRSRFQFNYYPSNRFNVKLFTSLNKLQRGQNNGLEAYSSKDSLMNQNTAFAVNPDAYEKVLTLYSDIKMTGRFFNDTLSLTNFNVFTNNSLREYRDEENRESPNGLFIGKNYHSIQYGFDLNQSINLIPFSKSRIKLLAGIKGYSNLYNYDRSSHAQIDSVIGVRYYDINALDLYSRLDLSYDKFIVSGAIKSQKFNNTYQLMYGAEVNYTIILGNEKSVTFKGGLNNTTKGFDYESLFYDEYFLRFSNNYDESRKQYYEAGIDFKYNNFSASFLNFYSNLFNSYSVLNTNISAGYNIERFAFVLNLNSFDGNNYAFKSMPRFFISSDIAYKDILFRNKLKLKTGFNIKYISDKPEAGFDQFSNVVVYSAPNSAPFEHFLVDFYIGARIGKANINITVANIFNSIIYNSSIYPFDDRDGLLRSISRFTITWDFWN